MRYVEFYKCTSNDPMFIIKLSKQSASRFAVSQDSYGF